MVKIGDTVTRKPVTFLPGNDDELVRGKNDEVLLRGKVVYVHPEGRYHTVEFMTAGGPIRESFQGAEK